MDLRKQKPNTGLILTLSFSSADFITAPVEGQPVLGSLDCMDSSRFRLVVAVIIWGCWSAITSSSINLVNSSTLKIKQLCIVIGKMREKGIHCSSVFLVTISYHWLSFLNCNQGLLKSKILVMGFFLKKYSQMKQIGIWMEQPWSWTKRWTVMCKRG